MVKKLALLATGVIVVYFMVAVSRMIRWGNDKDSRASRLAPVAEIDPEPPKESLTDDEAQECLRAFEEIGNAYSNLQFEVMQELFCGISNKVSRLGKDRVDKDTKALQTAFHKRFWGCDVKAREFSTISEFERFIRANIAAAHIIGCSTTENDYCDNYLLDYDMVVFRVISAFLNEFKERKDAELAVAAQALLDEWKEHLASGQSVTRMALRLQLKMSLRLPRWKSEDMGMKSKRDWVEYWRNCALKFYKQYYGVEPTWLDEEFPLEPDSDRQ